MAEAAIKYKSTNATRVVALGSTTKYYGYIVTVTTATAAIQIRDASAAATGTILDSIPSGSAAGTKVTLAHPIQCNTGLVLDLNGATGTVCVLYEGTDAS